MERLKVELTDVFRRPAELEVLVGRDMVDFRYRDEHVGSVPRQLLHAWFDTPVVSYTCDRLVFTDWGEHITLTVEAFHSPEALACRIVGQPLDDLRSMI